MRGLHTEAVLLLSALAGLALSSCGGEEPGRKSASASSAEASKEEGEEPDEKVVGELERIVERGREAFAARDWPQARRLAELGMRKAKDDERAYEEQRGMLLLLLADVERESGREVEARRHYADAMAIFRVEEDDLRRVRVHLAQSRLEAMLGDYPAAERQLTEARSLMEGVDDPVLKGELLLHSGMVASRRLRHEEAMKAFYEAAKIFDVAGREQQRAEAMLQLASEEDALGKTHQCRRSLDKALEAFRELGDRSGEVRALHRLAAMAEREGRYRRARSILGKVRELYEKLDRRSEAVKVEQHINSLPENDAEN